MKRRLLLAALVALLAAGVWWYTGGRSAKHPSLARDAAALAEASGVTAFDGQKALSAAAQTSETDASSGERPANPLEQAVGLAIQGIRLFQGEKGLELWRLNATWAHLSQDGEIINVDSPHVVYALGDTGLPPSRPGIPDAAPENGAAETSPADPTPSRSPEGETNVSAAASSQEADVLDVTAQKGRITDQQRRLRLWGDVVITRFGDTITGPLLEYDSATRLMTFPDGATFESERGNGTAAVLHWNLAQNEITGLNGVEVILKPRPQTPENTEPDSEGSRPAEAGGNAASAPQP